MKTVIRNGEYLFVEELLLNDIEVSVRPHPDAYFENGGWVFDMDNYLSSEDSTEATQFLKDSDWKVIRHRDQLALGVETSLTAEEYKNLLKQRQDSREKVISDTNC